MPDSPDTRGKGGASKRIVHGSHLVKGKSNHAMEDCLVCEFKQVNNNELGLFAIFDGHMGHDVANYLQTNLFGNILKEVMQNFQEELAVRMSILNLFLAFLQSPLVLAVYVTIFSPVTPIVLIQSFSHASSVSVSSMTFGLMPRVQLVELTKQQTKIFWKKHSNWEKEVQLQLLQC